MSGGISRDATTVARGSGREVSAASTLLVVDANGARSVALPTEGDLVIGRGYDVDVPIADEEASRRHAVIHVRPGVIEVEDLGSANGTWLGELQLAAGERVELGDGDTIDLGSTVVIVRLPSVAPQVVSREYLEGRLATARLRPGRAGTPYAIVRFRVAAGDRGACEVALRDELPAGSSIARFREDELVALLLDVSAEETTEEFRRACDRVARDNLRVAAWHAWGPRDNDQIDALLDGARGESTGHRGESIVIGDDRMRELHALAATAARSSISILVVGEPGVGKEVFAERVHRLSDRRDHRLVSLSCAALPEAQLEVELFGTAAGAAPAKVGLLEAASGGTLFLDEVAALPLVLQAKLARALETGKITPLGSRDTRSIDVRVVSATDRDLSRSSDSGAFRPDLLARLNGITLEIPPLRERRADVMPLARAFLARAAGQARQPREPRFTPEAVERLEAHSWPGNVRELRNIVERAAVLAWGRDIEARDLVFGPQPGPGAAAPVATPPLGASDGGELQGARDQAERDALVQALAKTHGNQTRAAKLLGIARSTFVKRMERFGLPRPRMPDDENDGET